MNNQKSIVVLPFHNTSSDVENDYFADGITEELINSLGKIKGLKVTARTSSFAYKNKKQDVRVIGNELGVATALEGSIRKAGNRVRIAAQLIRTDNGFHIWSERFDREMTDIFELQDEISLLIAEKIRENFGHIDIKEHLVTAQTPNIESYQFYLKGRFYQLNWKLEDFSRAIAFYKKSIVLDKEFSLPYFGLVQCYGIMGSWNFMDKNQALEEVEKYLIAGLSIDTESAPRYFAQATRELWVNWEPYVALGYLEQALSLSPNDSESLESAAECHTALGNFEDAIRYVNRALEVNPLSANHHYTKGNILYLQGNFEDAILWMDKALQIDNQWELALQIKACCYILMNEPKDLQELIAGYAHFPNENEFLLLDQLKNSDEDKSDQETDMAVEGYLPWQVYLPLYAGQEAHALDNLTIGVKQHLGQYINFLSDPMLESLRRYPAFTNLRAGLFSKEAIVDQLLVQDRPMSESRMSMEEADSFQSLLQKSMKDDKLFLDSGLTLRSLSVRIDLHPNKLSWLLNEIVGKNFNEFVNSFRLQEFTDKAIQPAYNHLTILGVAYECGFSSKSVFNDYFRKSMGLTPSAWLKKNR